jgi:hypothetical protein
MPHPPLHVVAAQAISADEARACLLALGTKPINATQLALEWGWTRSRVRRFVTKFRAQGLIAATAPKPTREPSPVKATRIEIRQAPTAPQPTPEPAREPQRITEVTIQQDAKYHDFTPEPSLTETVERVDDEYPVPPRRKPPEDPPPPYTPIGIRVIGLILGIAAILLGGIGLILNITFAQSFGPPGTIVGNVLALLFGVIDVLTILSCPRSPAICGIKDRSARLLVPGDCGAAC